MYKTAKSLSPAYLTDLISKHVPFRSLSFRDANLFYAFVHFLNIVITGLMYVDLFCELICLNT